MAISKDVTISEIAARANVSMQPYHASSTRPETPKPKQSKRFFRQWQN